MNTSFKKEGVVAVCVCFFLGKISLELCKAQWEAKGLKRNILTSVKAKEKKDIQRAGARI